MNFFVAVLKKKAAAANAGEGREVEVVANNHLDGGINEESGNRGKDLAETNLLLNSGL